MTSTSRITRTLLLGAVVVALASAGGCRWFKDKTNYLASKESQPLEVPPGLSVPEGGAAGAMPEAVVTAGTPPAARPNSTRASARRSRASRASRSMAARKRWAATT